MSTKRNLSLQSCPGKGIVYIIRKTKFSVIRAMRKIPVLYESIQIRKTGDLYLQSWHPGNITHGVDGAGGICGGGDADR